jgi:response regulator RpfG family c-di-GMP phosphodiesterase
MRSVYWVDQESFLRMMVEKTLKLAEIEIYTTASVDNDAYIIKDISPDLLVWDVSTLKELGAEVFNEIVKTTQIPVGLVGFPDQFDDELKILLAGLELPILEKPLSSITLVDQLEEMRERFLAKS